MAHAVALLDRGADVGAATCDGLTPLQLVVGRMSGGPEGTGSELVDELLKRGADINVLDEDGNTVLHRAASELNVGAIAELLRHGADVNARNGSGRQPAEMLRLSCDGTANHWRRERNGSAGGWRCAARRPAVPNKLSVMQSILKLAARRQ